ncbi:dipeptide ABC transporter ATP-binding protein [Brevibacterium gallinarum]|uniref:ABC transporter ATP-binding protein n=1 Tax=Brevibacterium gallinarum TaxID=2762220 RepID=A0ABR8WXS4_9MICO|nr:ABC transporter ATP-binding protein [Brevibacterium gallinarum]MBD8021893.1 ABC transporter ATP-binding protein [Brevibacterium gallinarum]
MPPNAVTSGSVVLDGHDTLSLSQRELRKLRGKKVAMIFQEPMTALDPLYPIGEQIAEAITAHQSTPKDKARSRALELLQMVGLPDPKKRISHYPHQLSGGQLQRVVIAMAVSCEPELLIADEPTTALDVTVQAEILELIRDLAERLNAGVLFITHDMGVVADIADRVIVLRDGSVVEEGEVHEIFATPKCDYTQHLLSSVPYLGQAQVSEGGDLERTDWVLNMDNVTISYPGRWGSPPYMAINNVSLSVGKGEVLGLVGESGSGKSTLGRCAVGLLKASSGHVKVCGTDITHISNRKLRPARKRFTMVFQDPASSVNPRETIGEIVGKPLRVHTSDNPSSIKARVEEMLERVRIPANWTGRYPHELSGGQRQRLGIARALILNPELLVADEPTSALDVSVQATVLELFKELQAELGFSCLFITHDLGVVEMLADRVAVLKSGQLIEVGYTADVLHNSKEEYTKRLVLSAPVPDPEAQLARRKAFAAL